MNGANISLFLRIIFIVFAAFITVQCSGGVPNPDATASDEMELLEPQGAALKYDDHDSVYVTASNLRARSMPSMDGRVVGSFANGDSVEILKRSGEWLQVVKNAEHVWISAKYVSKAARASRRPPVNKATTSSSSMFSGGHVWFGKKCKKGKPCGNACISVKRTCHK
ncbi:SH3 domain-containing protein [Novosphingobium indicum]|uniref:SH3 domain-containing protein n=1 Tax=Novosphingobium indicum TaxID=462949 RepID=UPI00166B23FF|nr:SH3 domain-containing protein [Novosphingobium indicum]